MSSTTPTPASSATIWFCGERTGFKYFSVQVQDYEKKQSPPIVDLGWMQSKHIDTGAGEHHDLSRCSAAVAVNGVVYVISGRRLRCDPRNPLPSNITIQRLDPTGPVTCHNDDRLSSWIQAAHLDAKIYIYGFDDDSAEPFFEVFDTVSKILDRLLLNSDVHDNLSYVRLLGVDSDKNIIFMRYEPNHDFVLYVYDTEQKGWGTVPLLKKDVERISLWESKRCVVAGKRIYWFTDMKTMMAFDLVDRSHYRSKVLAKFEGSFRRCDDLELESVILLHLNQNHFCLVSKYVFSDDVFITTLLVSSNAAEKSLTISLINTNRYEADGFQHCLRHALQLTEAVSMPIDTGHIMEEMESPDRDPIAAYLPDTGQRFRSEVSLSTWICVDGICDDGSYVPIDLISASESDGSVREVKRMRQDIQIEPFTIQTAGIFYCTHVAVGDKVYNIGGWCSDPTIGEACIKRVDIKTRTVEETFWMREGRIRPYVAELDGKIYIFGGNVSVRGDHKAASSEVFNINNGCCTLLPDGFERNYTLVGVDRTRNKIAFLLVNEEQVKCAMRFFDTAEHVWTTVTETRLDCHTIENFGHGNHVMVDTKLYWFAEARFGSYDVDRHEIGYSDEKKYGNLFCCSKDAESVYMFHLHDDVFCLAIEYDEVRLVCMAVRIDKKTMGDGMYKLIPEVLHGYSYTLPDSFLFSGLGAFRLP